MQQWIKPRSGTSDVGDVYGSNRMANPLARTIPVNDSETGGVGVGGDIPEAGFGQFQVPEMPAYVQGYTKRGGADYLTKTTPTMMQTRFGNATYRGGMAGYVNAVESPEYFESYRVKLGDHGVVEHLRWAPGYDWKGGIQGISSVKNFAGIQTRGGQLRSGAPKRADYVDIVDWERKVRPGLDIGNFPQAGGGTNYAGEYQPSRRTPFIVLDNDAAVLREMVEHNPWHILSHSGKQAKEMYEEEIGVYKDARYKEYRDGLESGHSEPETTITEPYWWKQGK